MGDGRACSFSFNSLFLSVPFRLLRSVPFRSFRERTIVPQERHPALCLYKMPSFILDFEISLPPYQSLKIKV